MLGYFYQSRSSFAFSPSVLFAIYASWVSLLSITKGGKRILIKSFSGFKGSYENSQLLDWNVCAARTMSVSAYCRQNIVTSFNPELTKEFMGIILKKYISFRLNDRCAPTDTKIHKNQQEKKKWEHIPQLNIVAQTFGG